MVVDGFAWILYTVPGSLWPSTVPGAALWKTCVRPQRKATWMASSRNSRDMLLLQDSSRGLSGLYGSWMKRRLCSLQNKMLHVATSRDTRAGWLGDWVTGFV